MFLDFSVFQRGFLYALTFKKYAEPDSEEVHSAHHTLPEALFLVGSQAVTKHYAFAPLFADKEIMKKNLVRKCDWWNPVRFFHL